VNQAEEHWDAVFENFEQNWDHPFQVTRQPNRTENFAFVHKSSLFIGLNLVGGLVHHQGEWDSRLEDQFLWVKDLVTTHALPAGGASPDNVVVSVVIIGHATPTSDHGDFFDPLRDFIRDDVNNTVPFLYINGDDHAWKYTPNFFGQSNFLRIQVEGGTREPPLQVNVNATEQNLKNYADVFSYDRMIEEIVI
jgi:hypothetical protein